MKNKDSLFNIKDYEIDKNIGRGDYSKVYLVRNVQDGHEYAAKVLKLESEEERLNIRRELSFIKRLNHPSLVKSIGFSFVSIHYSTKNRPTLLQEYYKNGTINKMIENERKGIENPNWNATKKYICLLGISHSMSYLHKIYRIHRYLSSENVFLDENFYPKVSNFHICLRFEDTMVYSGLSSYNVIYSAPEILEDDYFSKQSDVYAFGIIAYEITTSIKPYSELKNIVIYKMAKKIFEGYRPQFPKNTNQKIKNIITRILDKNPENLQSFEEIFDILSNDISNSQ